ncbi:MAG: hypothetical protein KIT69_03020 [Propionibacteriaceae bacterium]|nr:hypothetical protein [Propionibacteriaceae bacterium]
MSLPQLITIVGAPGSACEGDACLPASATEAEPTASVDEQPSAQESGNTAARNAR